MASTKRGDGIIADTDYSRDAGMPGWALTQKKTFTAWCNQYLNARNLNVTELRTAFHDGIALINLMEEISDKTIRGYTKKPRIRAQHMENCARAIQFIKSQGITLVGIGPEDMVDGELKLILGLIWTLILRYTINRGNGQEQFSKFGLLAWVQNQIKPYGVTCKDFTTSWHDGSVIYALTDSLNPGKLDFSTRSGNAVADTQKALDYAQKEFSIPALIEAQDLV
jgi:hypothetical protein